MLRELQDAAEAERAAVDEANDRAVAAERKRMAAQTDAVLANAMVLRTPQNQALVRQYAALIADV